MGRPSEKIDKEGKPLKVVGCTCVVLRIMIKISRAKDIIKCKKWVNKNLALVRIHEWTWIVISSQHVPFKDLWLVGMISIKSDPSVINSSSQHQDKGTLSAQLVSSSLSWMDCSWIISLLFQKDFWQGSKIWFIFSLSAWHGQITKFCVHFAHGSSSLSVGQSLVCAHIPVSLPPSLFFLSRKWCQYPALAADRCSDHHYWWCKGGWQMRLFCSVPSSLCIVYSRNVLR